jgi:hypothetical protein
LRILVRSLTPLQLTSKERSPRRTAHPERLDDIVVVLNVEIREMQRSRALAEVDADTALIAIVQNRP